MAAPTSTLDLCAVVAWTESAEENALEPQNA
jgi:hypothetical protein